MFGGRVAVCKMKKMIDRAVRGRSAAGQLRITELSDYTSDHKAGRLHVRSQGKQNFSSVFIDLDLLPLLFDVVCTVTTVDLPRLF